MVLHLLVFGKVRELVGQIKYAFVVGSLSVMTSRSNLDEKSLAHTHAVGHIVTLLHRVKTIIMVEVVYIHGWGWFELYHWLDLSMIVWLLILVCGMIYLPLFRAPPCSWWCNCLWREGTPPPCSPILSTAVHPLHGRSLFRDSVSYNVTTPGNYKITHLCLIYIYKTANVPVHVIVTTELIT